MKLEDATVPSHAPNAIRVDLGGDMALYLAPAKTAQARLARSETVDLGDVIHAQGGGVYRVVFLVAVVARRLTERSLFSRLAQRLSGDIASSRITRQRSLTGLTTSLTLGLACMVRFP